MILKISTFVKNYFFPFFFPFFLLLEDEITAPVVTDKVFLAASAASFSNRFARDCNFGIRLPI